MSKETPEPKRNYYKPTDPIPKEVLENLAWIDGKDQQIDELEAHNRSLSDQNTSLRSLCLEMRELLRKYADRSDIAHEVGIIDIPAKADQLLGKG